MHLLKIKIVDSCPNKDEIKFFYQEKAKIYNNDCGIDIIFPEDIKLPTNKVTKCHTGIACEFIPNGFIESGPFWVVPRSSISNTPLMLANSIGIIDPGYRGEILVALRCYIDRDHPSTIDDYHYIIKKGTRLVQIISPDGKPIKVEVVNDLSVGERGANGFGSTDVLVKRNN